MNSTDGIKTFKATGCRLASKSVAIWQQFRKLRTYNWYLGRAPGNVGRGSIVLYPYRASLLGCGLAGIVSIKSHETSTGTVDTKALKHCVDDIAESTERTSEISNEQMEKSYLGNEDLLLNIWQTVQDLKRETPFSALFEDPRSQREIDGITSRLETIISTESDKLAASPLHLN